MTTVISTIEFEQQPALAIRKATVEGQDVIVEERGRETAVLLSMKRYQELTQAADDRVWARFREARDVIYAATADIPESEIAEMIEEAVQATRQARR